MATFERFEDMEVWQLARTVTSKIYKVTSHGLFAKDYGLRGQIQRAAVSIVSNIAEGFERNSNGQFLQFLDVAIGSASEVRSQLYIALDLGYIDCRQFDELFADVSSIGRMLTRLIQYLRKSPNRLPPKPLNHQTIKPSNHQTNHVA